MPKNSLQNSQLKSTRKDDIVVCALKVFCEKGYHGATVNDIVKKAKCSHGLFYHYFKNKKEIFDAVAEIRGESMMDFLDKVLLDDGNYAQKLEKLTKYTFDNIKKDEAFAYKYYFFLSTVFIKVESGELPPKGKVPPHVRMFWFFKEALDKGDLRCDYGPENAATLYNCIMQGATLNFILCPKEFKKNYKFPDIDQIINIFKKEN